YFKVTCESFEILISSPFVQWHSEADSTLAQVIPWLNTPRHCAQRELGESDVMATRWTREQVDQHPHDSTWPQHAVQFSDNRWNIEKVFECCNRGGQIEIGVGKREKSDMATNQRLRVSRSMRQAKLPYIH